MADRTHVEVAEESKGTSGSIGAEHHPVGANEWKNGGLLRGHDKLR